MHSNFNDLDGGALKRFASPVGAVTSCLGAVIAFCCSIGDARSEIKPASQLCAQMLESKPMPSPISDVYELARRTIEPKGQFESTAAFETRVDSAVPVVRKALVGAYGTSRIVIQVPLIAPYLADYGYFDIGWVSVTPITGPNNFKTEEGRPPDYELVKVEGSIRESGEYAGQNAYGASRTVNSETRDEYGVGLVDLELAKSSSWLRSHFVLPMARERAAAIKGRLSLMIIGDFTSPGLIEGYSRQSPTLQDPRDVTVRKRYIALTGACGAIVETESRQLLRRLN